MACQRFSIMVMVAILALAPAVGLATTIYDVQYNETTQGTGDDCYPSPLDDQQVTIEGVVTAVVSGAYPNFWLEEPDGGLWKGVYVYDASVGPSQGDRVSITATPDEYYGMTEMKNLTDFQIISSGNPLPPAMDIGTGDLAGGCNAVSEAYEGLLVRVSDVVVTQAPNSYGEWYVDDGSGECQIDDYLFQHSPAVGDTFGAILGVVQWGFGEYEINPRDAADLGLGPPDTAYAIYDVQYNETDQGPAGECFPSPFNDLQVTVEGIVTAVTPGLNPYFWLQSPDKGLWSGVYCYDISVTPSQGDRLSLTADVDEYYGLTELKNITEFEIISSGNPLPAVVDLETGDLAGGCNSWSEAYEGMLVRVMDVVVTQEVSTYGEWYVDDGSGQCQVDDDLFHHEPTLGDTFAAIIGVVDYSFDEYEIIPRDAGDIQTEITAVEADGDHGTLPAGYALLQNNPNPFNPQTEIRYVLPEKATIRLSVYNLLGQKVATLADGFHDAGEFAVRWDGTDDRDGSLASGVYFYRLQAGEFSATRKMIYLR
jgi:hypothetical protein